MPCLSNGHHRINIFHIPGKPTGIKNVMNFKKQKVTVACITVRLCPVNLTDSRAVFAAG
ncbi:translation initiation factor IF-1 family protein [Escherichia coli 99.0741]|nr:translation initiation factor IF-1 family protein [Escherichia coli 99.0741]